MTWKAAFPMYNVSERVRAGYEDLFGAVLARLRADGFEEPVELVRDAPLPGFFQQPGVLLAQTCGYPYLTQLRGHVQLVATPVYGFPGCHGADYSSAIVVRDDGAIASLEDARGRIVAANDSHSNSGMNALRHAVAPLARAGRYFGAVRWSGSHRASLELVQRGDADIAAIDCVTLGYLGQELPGSVQGMRVLRYSAPSPGLPIVTGADTPAELRQQLRRILLAPDEHIASLLAPLSLHGFADRDDADYARILALETEARQLGYPSLA